MKKKFLITSAVLSFSAFLGVGALVGVASTKAPVKAEATTVQGKLVAKLGNAAKWSGNNAKLAAYLTDDTNTYWTDLQSIGSDTMFIFDYSVSFTPTKLIWVRMDPAATSGNWDQKWNQTSDLALAEATYLNDDWNPSGCSQWTLTAGIRSSLVPSFGEKTTLSANTVTFNSSGNPEVSGLVTLEKDEEFKVLAGDGTWTAFWSAPNALEDCFSGGNRDGYSNDDPNIVCEKAGTYEFFFDTETKFIWITRDDIVKADGFASTFLSSVGCDATGRNLPTGWDDMAELYADLDGAAKDYLWDLEAGTSATEGTNIERCLYQYDYAVAHHSTLDKFITDSTGTHVRAVNPALVISENTYSPAIISSNTTFIIITIVAVASVTAIGCTLLIKRRKGN